MLVNFEVMEIGVNDTSEVVNSASRTDAQNIKVILYVKMNL